MELMKAARLHEISERLIVGSMPVPQLGTEDVLVDIRAAGICHSDMNYRDGVSPVAKLPITLGHEIAGVVSKKGEEAIGVECGDRVCVHYVIGCGECEYCTSGRENYCEKYQMIGKDVDGGFAEYIKVPATNILRIPDSLPFEQAAILCCAVSTAYHALRRGRAKAGETVLINGVGGLGLHAVQLASKVFGAREIIAVDVLGEKLELAAKFGATQLINVSGDEAEKRIDEATEGRRVDLAVDFVGRRSTIEGTICRVGKGGRLVIVGISTEQISLHPYSSIIGKEMEIIGVNDHLKSELNQLIQYIEIGKLDLSSSITHRVSLEDVNMGLQILQKNLGNPVRVVVTK